MRNDKLLNSNLNKNFEDILSMTNEEFRQWCIDIRKLVVKLWDEDGLPPIVGYSEAQIEQAFQEMYGYPVHTSFPAYDEYAPEYDKTGAQIATVIRNTSNYSGYVNSWFPTMMKTRINYSKNDDGKSIYDFFAREDLLDTFITYASRHFKRDSFYAYSNPIKARDIRYIDHLPMLDDGFDWILAFEVNSRYKHSNWGWWLCPVKGTEYTGYDEKLKGQKFLELTYDQIRELQDQLQENIIYKKEDWQRRFGNIDPERSKLYQIRVYEKNQKLFPVGLKAWKVSFCQYAVNFPPLTAKYLYEKYTRHIKDENIVIYDPSMGWGGRLVGAMSVEGKNVTYVGTDPNTDHNVGLERTKYHEIADFYRAHVRRGGIFDEPHAITDFYKLGSEVIGYDPRFQQYRGKLDIVFTSPPYFAKEAYSEDPEQSYKKFPNYVGWRDGFLRPTLTTAVEYLKSDRYLLWNIADAKFGNDMLPLEKDSRDILESLGMKYIRTEKMALAQMPGGNRIDKETGLPKAKNFCKVNNNGINIWLKYEPVFVFYKP